MLKWERERDEHAERLAEARREPASRIRPDPRVPRDIAAGLRRLGKEKAATAWDQRARQGFLELRKWRQARKPRTRRRRPSPAV